MSAAPYSNAQMVFQMQYESVRRDEVIGVLLAFFLGCFGLHHFYVGRVGLGILYCCFSWTGITAILGLIECFFMPGRVRIYNAAQATALAASLGILIPGYLGFPSWTGYPSATGYSSATGFPTSPAPGYGYPQPAHLSAQTQPPSTAFETTRNTCGNCLQTNPPGARFCCACGSQLG